MLIKKTRIPVLHMLFIGMLPSFLKKAVYRLKGYRIGKNVRLKPGSVILGQQVVIEDFVQVGFLTMIRGTEIHIGRFVKIGSMSVIDTGKIFIDEDARINEQVFRWWHANARIRSSCGKRAIIMQLSYINPTLPIRIGDDSGIGGHCLLFTHGSWSSELEGYPVRFAPIDIGNKVWLPWRVFVLPGVKIGDGSVIGAGSLVTSSIPAHSLAAGSPAKVMKENFPDVPGDETKKSITERIFNEFAGWLRFSGFTVERSEEENGFTLRIAGPKKSGTLVYREQADTLDVPAGDSVLVLKSGDVNHIHSALKAGYKMVLCLETPGRVGTGDTGEELASFFPGMAYAFPVLIPESSYRLFCLNNIYS